MKNKFFKISFICGLMALFLSESACKKDYLNPNAATADQVYSSVKGLTGVVIGLQRLYTLGRGSNLYNSITINGLTTNELIVVNPSMLFIYNSQQLVDVLTSMSLKSSPCGGRAMRTLRPSLTQRLAQARASPSPGSSPSAKTMMSLRSAGRMRDRKPEVERAAQAALPVA